MSDARETLVEVLSRITIHPIRTPDSDWYTVVAEDLADVLIRELAAQDYHIVEDRVAEE